MAQLIQCAPSLGLAVAFKNGTSGFGWWAGDLSVSFAERSCRFAQLIEHLRLLGLVAAINQVSSVLGGVARGIAVLLF